jgi:hypothetical protein
MKITRWSCTKSNWSFAKLYESIFYTNAAIVITRENASFSTSVLAFTACGQHYLSSFPSKWHTSPDSSTARFFGFGFDHKESLKPTATWTGRPNSETRLITTCVIQCSFSIKWVLVKQHESKITLTLFKVIHPLKIYQDRNFHCPSLISANFASASEVWTSAFF